MSAGERASVPDRAAPQPTPRRPRRSSRGTPLLVARAGLTPAVLQAARPAPPRASAASEVAAGPAARGLAAVVDALVNAEVHLRDRSLTPQVDTVYTRVQ